MHILERVDGYVEEVKQTPYIYKMQKVGIEVFRTYINAYGLDIREEDFHRDLLNKLLLIWLPKNKKYLGEAEIYQIIYTIHDLVNYIEQKSGTLSEQDEAVSPEENTILQLYGEAYMRIYKARNLLQQITKDPIISVNPIVVDLERYKDRRKKTYNEIATTYEQALFEIQECKDGGQIIMCKIGYNKQYKLLLEYPAYKYLRKGDILHAVIKRKLFYVYWELEEIKAYYLPQALSYLS